MSSNTIQSIMTTDVVSLSRGTQAKNAIILMSKNNISCIIIIEDDKPVGIITERDILRIAAQHTNINSIKVEDVMSCPVKTVSKDMDIYKAAIYLEKHNLRRIVITDGEGILLGLVTQTDLKNHLGAAYYVKLKSIDSIMDKNVITAEYDENLQTIIQRMNEHTSSYLVISRNKSSWGMITERDITHLMAAREDIANLRVKDVIKPSVISVSNQVSIYEASNLMKKRGIRRLVVTDKNKSVVGIVTESDIVKHLVTEHVKSLRSLVEKDRTYIESIKEGLFECSPNINGKFTWINQAGATILGYKFSEQVIGKNIKDIFFNGQDLNKLFSILETKGLAKDFCTILKKKNGIPFQAEGSFYFVKDEYGKIICIEGILRDITERKILEDKLKRYSEELEKKVKERTNKIRKQNRELEKMNAKLQELSNSDGLTGIKNFRYFSQVLDIEFKKAVRYRLPLSCIILDIDDFKFINDRLGHSAGDYVLIKTASRLEKIIRETDIVARYGGDEFTIIMPNTNLENACIVGNKILRYFRKYHLRNGLQALGKISLSIGISSLPDKKIKKSQLLLEYADKAMYRAKEHGKNNICTFEEID